MLWFYDITFVLDCPNHNSENNLFWKRSLELFNGDKYDISPFIVKIWKTLKFFDKLQLPNSLWIITIVIGIAWEMGY